VSPSDQPLEITINLSRAEAVVFLEKLAHHDGFRAEFEQNPYDVLSENGIEVTPAEAVPSTVTAPSPEDIDSAIESLEDPEPLGWNAQLRWSQFPFIGLLAKPMEDGGSEAA
jgi:hypothetical protein